MDIYAQLRRDEGVRRFPYRDTVGDITIGVGRNLSSDGLSDGEIEYLLVSDVTYVTETLEKRLPWFAAVDPIRQAAIVNMAFNLGFDGLEGFPEMLQAFAQGNWEEAATQMLASKWSQQVGARAQRLAQQVRTGEWV